MPPGGRPCAAAGHGGRSRQQPGDLGAHLVAEHSGDTGAAPHAAAVATATTDRAGLVAGDPAEAVVAESEVPERIVLAATDVRPGTGRHQLHDEHPPATRED